MEATNEIRERILVRAYAVYLNVPSVRDLLDTLPRDYPFQSRVLNVLISVSIDCIIRRHTTPEEVMSAYLKAGGNEEALIQILTDEGLRFENMPEHALRDTINHFIGAQIADRIDSTTSDFRRGFIDRDEYAYNLKSISDGGGVVGDMVHSIQDIISRNANPQDTHGIAVLPPWMNTRMKGLRRGRTTLLACRPGVGKTDFSLEIIRRALAEGYKILHISMEMDEVEILSRMYNSIGGDAFAELVEKQLYSIIDEGRVSIPQIASIINSGGYDLVVIDYLQILESDKKFGSLYEKVTHLSNELRIAAKNSDAAWLVLSQFSRHARSEHERPVLADLRDSGSLEQDAFAVILGYEPLERVKYEGVYAPSRLVSWYVAKNRGGGIGDFSYRFIMSKSTWEQLSQAEYNAFEEEELKKLEDYAKRSKPEYDRGWMND